MAELNEPLSERELDVLALVVQGASNKDIAQTLFISPNTVKVHLRNIYTKLGVSTRTEATVTAVELKLVSLSGEIPPAEAEGEEEEPADEAEISGGENEEPETAGLDPRLKSSELGVGEPPGEAGAATNSRAIGWLWPAIALLAVVVAVLAVAAQRLPGSAAGIITEATATPPADTQIEETRWFVTQAVGQPVWGAVLISAGVDLFQIGGQNAAGEVTGSVSVFDSTGKEWRTAADKPTAVSEAGGANLGGILYVVGGKNAAGDPVNIVEAYIPSEDQWRPVANLPRALFGGTVIQDGVHLYHLGGFDGREAVDDAYVYDPSTNGWRALPPLLESLAFASGGFLENNLFIVGGENGRGKLDSCQRFDPQAETWRACAPLSEPRARAGAAVVLNKLYLLGGETDAHFGELLDPKTGIWEIINVPMLSAAGSSDWLSPGVTNIEAKIFLIGGRRASGEINDSTFVYAPLVYQSFFPSTQTGGAPDP